jgi:hypothetical protein
MVEYRDLQVDEDLDFQRREWAFQRAGWVVLLLLVVAAALGLFGSGPLSDALAEDGSGTLRVEYERFARFHGPATVKVELGPGSVTQDEARLVLSRRFVERIAQLEIAPEPDQAEMGADTFTYVFRAREPGSVTLRYLPDHFGTLDTTIAIEDGPAVEISQFVYP